MKKNRKSPGVRQPHSSSPAATVKAQRLTRAAPVAQRNTPPISLTLSPTVSAAAIVEDVIGCKWSLHVLNLVRRGINRPGAMARAVPGLTPKVLSQRLDKFLRFGIFTRIAYPEIPPRVEYQLTPFGKRFLAVVDAVEHLQRSMPAHSESHTE